MYKTKASPIWASIVITGFLSGCVATLPTNTKPELSVKEQNTNREGLAYQTQRNVNHSAPENPDNGGWEVSFEDGSTCIASGFKFYPDVKTSNYSKYQKDPSSFGNFLKHFNGKALFEWPQRTPFESFVELTFVGMSKLKMNSGTRIYSAKTRSGEIFPEVKDTNGTMELCPYTEQSGSVCVQASYVGVQCENGNEQIVRFAYLAKAPPNGRQFTYLRKAKWLDETTLAQRREALALAQQAAERQRAQREKIANDQREQAILDAKRKQADFLSTLRNAPLNTVMFCTTGSLLMTAGQVISQSAFTCDLTGSHVFILRDAIKLGWDVVSETRTPHSTMLGGVGMEVSLQLRKSR
ncbi:hypothetical protein [Thauera propionica]|uniref:hypothetical protein n=1 Tax=Thauera propionica TaxID=2019431 RepID=UPI0010560DAA|nr:hypothetical protein [Thauera propionica]